jgi:hypothetical protein
MSPFAKGFVVGIVVVWGYHKFVRPLPGGAATGPLSGRS